MLVLVNVHVNEVNMHMLDHEKLDVYKVSIEFMAIAINIADSLTLTSTSTFTGTKNTLKWDEIKKRGDFESRPLLG